MGYGEVRWGSAGSPDWRIFARSGSNGAVGRGMALKPFWDAVSAAKKMGIPVFLRGETSDKIAEKGGIFGLVRNFALHRLFAKVDYFLAIGKASRRFYLKHGVPERKLVDTPYGVDNEFFRREADGIRQTAYGKRTEENSHEDAQDDLKALKLLRKSAANGTFRRMRRW